MRLLESLLGRKELRRDDDLRPELQRILLCNDSVTRKRETLQRLATEQPFSSFLASDRAEGKREENRGTEQHAATLTPVGARRKWRAGWGAAPVFR